MLSISKRRRRKGYPDATALRFAASRNRQCKFFTEIDFKAFFRPANLLDQKVIAFNGGREMAPLKIARAKRNQIENRASVSEIAAAATGMLYGIQIGKVSKAISSFDVGSISRSLASGTAPSIAACIRRRQAQGLRTANRLIQTR